MDFDVGDRVRFRDLDEITHLNDDGKIRFGWNVRMNPLCGMEFTIKEIEGNKIYFKEDVKELHDTRYENEMWSISASMLEHAPENNGAADEIIADDHLFDMLMC